MCYHAVKYIVKTKPDTCECIRGADPERYGKADSLEEESSTRYKDGNRNCTAPRHLLSCKKENETQSENNQTQCYIRA